MLDEILEIFERDKKKRRHGSTGKRSLLGRVSAMVSGEDHRRHDDRRIDLLLRVVDRGSRDSSNTDHERTCAGGRLHRHPHQDIHDRDLDDAAADTQHPGQGPRKSTDRETGPDPLGDVSNGLFRRGIDEFACQAVGIGCITGVDIGASAPAGHREGAVHQHHREDNVDCSLRCPDADDRTNQCPKRGRDLQDHRQAQIGEAAFEVDRRTDNGVRRDGDRAGPDREFLIDAEEQREDRNQEDSPTQAEH